MYHNDKHESGKLVQEIPKFRHDMKKDEKIPYILLYKLRHE